MLGPYQVALAAPGSTSCIQLDASKLIHAYAQGLGKNDQSLGDPDIFAQDETMKIQATDNPSLRWAGMGLDGWPIGFVFAVDCDGKILNAIDTGSVESMQLGPPLPGYGQTVLINATTGIGSGAVGKAFSLVGFKENRIITLWKHDSLETGYFPRSAAEELEFKIVELTDTRISLQGEHRIYPWIEKKTKKKEEGDWSKTPQVTKTAEAFCWDGNKSTYSSCTNAAPATR